MADLRRRLQRLEANLQRLRGAMPAAAPAHSAQQCTAAAAALFDVIESHYGPISSDEAVSAAAARVQAGAETDVDRSALVALPEWALRIVSMTSREVLIAVGTLDTWKQANGITDEDLMAHAREAW